MGVPAHLGSRQGPGIAAQIGKMRRKSLRHAHGKAPSAQRKAQGRNLRQPKKFHGLPEPSRNLYVWNLGRGTEWGFWVEIRCLARFSGMARNREMAWPKMTQQWDASVANEEKPSEK